MTWRLRTTPCTRPRARPGALAVAVAVAVVLLIGCSTVEQRALSPGEVERHLPSVFGPATSRDDLLLQFGAPSASFEGGRILAWRFVEQEDRAVPAALESGAEFGQSAAWSRSRFSLVVVFDARGVVHRHALIAVR